MRNHHATGRRWSALCGLVALTLFVGCSAGRGGASEPLENVQIAVDQAGSITGSMRIWLVPDIGVRRLAGTTDGSGIDTVSIPGVIQPGLFRLVAEPTIGRALVSNPFSLDSPDAAFVEWNLVTNSVFVRRPG